MKPGFSPERRSTTKRPHEEQMLMPEDRHDRAMLAHQRREPVEAD